VLEVLNAESEIVNGQETKPAVIPIITEVGTPQPSSSPSAAAVDATNLAEVTAWTKKSNKACVIISSSVTAEIMVHLEGLESPVEMWRTLADLYNLA
jgi:hypothetical protein